VNDHATGARKVTLATAEHYSWGAGCDGWHLVRRPEMSIIRESMPPGASEVRHFHTAARQFFFVLSGTAHLEVSGVEFALEVGEGVEVAAGAAHQMFNRSQAEVQFLVVSQPPSHGDRTVVSS
jgi:mannose-6-phosphate isomerase-like protein (cupin superfamily)